MTYPRFVAIVFLLVLFPGWRLRAAAIPAPAFSVAIDIDSRIDRGGVPRPIITEPGFISWDLTNVTAAGGPPLAHEGVMFEIFGPSGSSMFGSRNRGSAGGLGGDAEEILADMVFADYFDQCFVGLRISGLPVGRYAMTSWHFDSHPYALADDNHIQIEVATVGEVGQVVVDHFPLGASPAQFEFAVASTGQATEIRFREDDEVPFPSITFPNQRARLNGFTLTSIVPEPASAGLQIWLTALLCIRLGQKRSRNTLPKLAA